MKIITLILFSSLAISIVSGQRGGRSDGGRVVGGEDIKIYEAPYQASLLYYGYHICGGAIISKDYVITAAHCTFGRQAKSLSVRVGSTKNYEEGDIHEVQTIKTHPYYNRLTFDFDVALLQLKTQIIIDDFTKQEITMVRYGERLPEKTPVLVTGWGETRNENETSTILRAVIVAVSNQNQCNIKYKSDGGVTNRMFCAYELKKDSCAGDSGGPVRRLSDGKLVGLVSFGPGNECALPEWPGAYTRLAAVRPWIKSNTRI